MLGRGRSAMPHKIIWLMKWNLLSALKFNELELWILRALGGLWRLLVARLGEKSELVVSISFSFNHSSNVTSKIAFRHLAWRPQFLRKQFNKLLNIASRDANELIKSFMSVWLRFWTPYGSYYSHQPSHTFASRWNNLSTVNIWFRRKSFKSSCDKIRAKLHFIRN